ncbi:hypothetical protein ElyMa_001452600 [Elysia marginata]|uniref:Uncharacterized protein n=1 Tax=Elysia marginata TaxID=1093978 RepID=A0AAV4J124_9GAST|nr:hypothetical protein ElyMa_001452600 [Elysia marginata]
MTSGFELWLDNFTEAKPTTTVKAVTSTSLPSSIPTTKPTTKVKAVTSTSLPSRIPTSVVTSTKSPARPSSVPPSPPVGQYRLNETNV